MTTEQLLILGGCAVFLAGVVCGAGCVALMTWVDRRDWDREQLFAAQERERWIRAREDERKLKEAMQ